jgi:small GTP-binding protein
MPSDRIKLFQCPPMSQEPIRRLKIVILGNAGSGKTSLVYRWTSAAFLTNPTPTMGTSHQLRRMELESGESVDLYIWDTAGQERFHSLMPLYTRACDLAIITTAVNDQVSFESIPKWIEMVTFASEVRPPMVLAVNKMDLAESSERAMDDVHTEHGKEFGTIFFVSAKTGENCEPLIHFIAKEAAEFNRRSQKQSALGEKESTGGCC